MIPRTDRRGSLSPTPGSVAQTLAALSKLYSWASKVGAARLRQPGRGVRADQVGPSPGFLSREEITQRLALVEEEEPDMLPIVATGVYTG
jgi:hypothetical protein